VSETTVIGCGDKKFRPIGKLILKGKIQELEVFEPLSISSQSQLSDHKVYLDAYERLGDDNALEVFDELAETYPNDHLVKFHHRRLKQGKSGKTIVMRSK
jgi:adenylate cyclase